MASAPTFVKVTFGDSRLVIPCGKPADKVSRLIQDVNRRFQSYLGDPTARVKELWTDDGFFINPNDAISEVIFDGARITASDYNAWMKDQLGLLKEAWHKADRTDFVDDSSIWAEVGVHKHNKLYIKLGTNKNATRLELFSMEELQSFGKGGKPLIAREQTKDEEKGIDRFVEASFVVTGNVVTAVELIVKSTSDPRPQVERFSIPAGTDLKKGTATVVQAADYPVPNKKYTLPAPAKKGKTLDEVMKCRSKADPDEEEKQKDFANNKSTGNCALELSQKDEPQADQGWYDANTKSFDQYLYINLGLLKKSEKTVAITKVSLEYQNKQGNWVPCDSISLGYKQRAWYYSWNQYDPTGFSIEESVSTMAVRAGIKVNALSYDKIRRIHHSLPDPLQVKIWFEDADGGKSSIVVEYKNGPRTLDDEKSKRKDAGDENLIFVSTDDLDAEARIWFTLSVEQDGRWGTIVKYGNWKGSGGKYFYDSDIKKILYKATKENKSELVLDEQKVLEEKLGCGVNTTALVDLKEHYVYGLKFELFTSTSSTTYHYLLPPFTKPGQ